MFSIYIYRTCHFCKLTFKLDGTHNQRLAVVVRPQASFVSSPAATAAAGVVVEGRTNQDFALDVHFIRSSEELEGLKAETGQRLRTTTNGVVGAVNRTSEDKTYPC